LSTHKRRSFRQIDGPEANIGSGIRQCRSMAPLVGSTARRALVHGARDAHDEALRDRLAALLVEARRYALMHGAGALERALDRVKQRLR
jgi:hypothetical protein